MKALLLLSCVVGLVVGMSACSQTSVDPTSSSSARTGGVTSTSATGPSSLTAVDVSSLPTAITSYVSANYAGATIKDARKDKDGNYVVAILVNKMLKLLLFRADGTFVKEAELKFGHHPGDSTHHHMPKDSVHYHAPADTTHRPHPANELTPVAVSNLPATITSYVSTNYAGATIERAAQDKQTSDYIVLIVTSDKKRVALLFSSDGTFKKAVTGR